jgi:hypothetical protein
MNYRVAPPQLERVRLAVARMMRDRKLEGCIASIEIARASDWLLDIGIARIRKNAHPDTAYCVCVDEAPEAGGSPVPHDLVYFHGEARDHNHAVDLAIGAISQLARAS